MITLWSDPAVKALFNEAPWNAHRKIIWTGWILRRATTVMSQDCGKRLQHWEKVTKCWEVYGKFTKVIREWQYLGSSDWIISVLNVKLDKVLAYIVSWPPSWQYEYSWLFLRSHWLMHQLNTPEGGTERDWPGPFHWGSSSPSASSSSSSSVQCFGPFSSSSPSSSTARDSWVLGSVESITHTY